MRDDEGVRLGVGLDAMGFADLWVMHVVRGRTWYVVTWYRGGVCVGDKIRVTNMVG